MLLDKLMHEAQRNVVPGVAAASLNGSRSDICNIRKGGSAPNRYLGDIQKEWSFFSRVAPNTPGTRGEI
jgi:hypothetical protein